MELEMNPLTVLLIILLVVFFLIILVAALGLKISEFCDELQYLNMELRRASPDRKKAWRRRRRRLWLSLLPFIKY